MYSYSESPQNTVVQQICRWTIVTVFFLNLLFYLAGQLFIHVIQSIESLTDYFMVQPFFEVGSFLILTGSFVLLSFFTPNKYVKIGSWCVAGYFLLELIFRLLLFFNIGGISQESYAIIIWSIIWIITYGLLLTGVLLFCKDDSLRERVPKLSVLYIFFIGSMIGARVFGYVLPMKYSTSIILNGFNGILGIVYDATIPVIATLFWFFILKPKYPSSDLFRPKQLLQPSFIAVASIAVLVFIINFIIFH